MLQIRNVHKAFVDHLRGQQKRTVLRGVDLHVPPGACVVLTGPSGSGKSSLLRCAYRSYRVDSGQIELTTAQGPLDLASADERQILAARQSTIGMVTQFLSVTPRVSALDLVRGQGVSRRAAQELLSTLGLPGDVHSLPPATFSGGEKQLVNLAMALARPRPLLLLDEATASLDRRRRDTVLRVLAEMKEAGTALLAIFHDLPTDTRFVDSVVELSHGRLKESA